MDQKLCTVWATPPWKTGEFIRNDTRPFVYTHPGSSLCFQMAMLENPGFSLSKVFSILVIDISVGR